MEEGGGEGEGEGRVGFRGLTRLGGGSCTMLVIC